MPERDVQLSTNRMKPAELVSTRFAVTLAPDHNHDDLMNPAYFAHVAPQLQPGNILEVRTDTGSHYGRFYVKACGRNHAELHELEWVVIDEPEEIDSEDFFYAWKGPIEKHCILRQSDGLIVERQLPTKKDALELIASRRKAA